MSERENGRHVQSSADDLDIGAGFAVAGGLHRGLEFAERRDPRGEPIGASERERQFGISPRRQIVVGPIRIFFQGSLDKIAFVVENKDGDIGGEPAHAADLVRRQLVGALPGNEDRASARIGERNAKGSGRRPADRAPQDLSFDPHPIRERHRHQAKPGTASFKNDRISSTDEGGVAWIERIHRDLVRWLPGDRRRRAFDRSAKRRGGQLQLCEFDEHVRKADAAYHFLANPDVIETDGDKSRRVELRRIRSGGDVVEADAAKIKHEVGALDDLARALR